MDTKYLEIIKAPVITHKMENMFSKLILELIK